MNYNCGDNITIFNNGSIYIVNKEPYETIEDCYKRGWYIINNIKDEDNYIKLYSMSIIYNNKNKGMIYN